MAHRSQRTWLNSVIFVAEGDPGLAVIALGPPPTFALTDNSVTTPADVIPPKNSVTTPEGVIRRSGRRHAR
jgi:hypothetical protein